MAERRSLFKMIFGEKKQQATQATMLQMLNSVPSFSSFRGDGYDSGVVRAAVDAFARNVGKLQPRHMKRRNGRYEPVDDELTWYLQERPNMLMNAYIFYYRLATQYLMTNNAFVWIRRDDQNRVTGLFPLNSSFVELKNWNGGVAVNFRFYDGNQYAAPYEDIIHIRRHFYTNDFFGESNRQALNPTLELINTTDQGVANAVKTSAILRGILKFTGMIKPEDMKAQTEMFKADYLNAANNGGIAATDTKAEYQELKGDPKMIDDKLMNAIADKVDQYFGTNAAIVKSEFDEEGWAAYYESMIEPFAVQAGLEFTYKLFSVVGNRREQVIFEANRLQYASNETKIKVVELLTDRGLISQNQALEIFNMPPISDGDKRIISLNFIDADAATAYQLGKVKVAADSATKGGENGNDEGDNGKT